MKKFNDEKIGEKGLDKTNVACYSRVGECEYWCICIWRFNDLGVMICYWKQTTSYLYIEMICVDWL